MRILIYGGSFNPPHLGHEDALRSALDALQPDRCIVIPAGLPPHKELSPGSPTGAERLALCRLAFGGLPHVECSDTELRREGKSYTVDTLREISAAAAGAELYFLIGTDMLESIENWYSFREILSMCTLLALARGPGEQERLEEAARYLRRTYGAGILLIRKEPLPMASTDLRRVLPLRGGRESLSEGVYAEIVRRRYYNARPDLDWLRERAYAMLKPTRVPHVQGCEQEAVRLAERWGEDPGDAAEAAILHDCTKKLSPAEQLELCHALDVPLDPIERAQPKLLHARTGAYLARERFGVSDAVFQAIQWHTTGRPGMTALEEIIYLADFTEPTRSFPGLEKVRELTYKDLDEAMIQALLLSMDEVSSHGTAPHPRSKETLEWLKKKRNKENELN